MKKTGGGGMLGVASVLGLLGGMGCGPHYKVVRQATPNPLVGASSLGFARMQLGPGVTDIAGGELVGCYDRAVEEQGRGLVTMPPLPGMPFVVLPTLVSVDASRLVAKTSAHGDIHVKIVDAKGALVDEITASRSDSQSSLSLGDAGKGSVSCEVGKKLASDVLEYLAERRK